MKPTTQVTLAVRAPGQRAMTQAILRSDPNEAKTLTEDGKLFLMTLSVEDAIKTVAQLSLRLPLTNHLQFGIFKSKEDAIAKMNTPSRSALSGRSNGELSMIDSLNDLITQQAQAGDDIAFSDSEGSVTFARLQEALESPEGQMMQKYSRADTRTGVDSSVLDIVRKAYAETFPDVFRFAPKWAE